MSETAKQVYVAINAVTAAMAKEGLAKGRRNTQQGYDFRGIDDVYCAISGLLAAQKLCILPYVQDRQILERPTKSGGLSTYTILTVDFVFVSAIDGSSHTIRTVGEAMDTADKSTNKAMSAAMKYACLLAFQIPTEGDNDADGSHHEKAAPRGNDNGNGPVPSTNGPKKAESDPIEAELSGLYAAASTADEIAKADHAASKYSQAKKLTTAARQRVLPIRAAAIDRAQRAS